MRNARRYIFNSKKLLWTPNLFLTKLVECTAQEKFFDGNYMANTPNHRFRVFLSSKV